MWLKHVGGYPLIKLHQGTISQLLVLAFYLLYFIVVTSHSVTQSSHCSAICDNGYSDVSLGVFWCLLELSAPAIMPYNKPWLHLSTSILSLNVTCLSDHHLHYSVSIFG